MNEQGNYHPTRPDASTVHLNEGFWEAAQFVERRPRRKASVHLRLDPETLAFFRSQGRGHLTRMAEVLRAYAQSQSKR